MALGWHSVIRKPSWRKYRDCSRRRRWGRPKRSSNCSMRIPKSGRKAIRPRPSHSVRLMESGRDSFLVCANRILTRRAHGAAQSASRYGVRGWKPKNPRTAGIIFIRCRNPKGSAKAESTRLLTLSPWLGRMRSTSHSTRIIRIRRFSTAPRRPLCVMSLA